MTANQQKLQAALVAVAGSIGNCISQIQAQDSTNIQPIGAGYADADIKADVATLQAMQAKYTNMANTVQDAASVG